MKMKKYIPIVSIIAFMFGLLVSSCMSPVQDYTPSAGKGAVRLNIGTPNRTLLPDHTLSSYGILFTSPGKEDVSEEITDGVSGDFELEVGTWTVRVQGFLTGIEDPVAEGRGTAVVAVGTEVTVPINLYWSVPFETGSGTFIYNITFPDSLTLASMKLTKFGLTTAYTTVNLLTAGTVIPDSVTETINSTGTLAGVPAGYYELVINLREDISGGYQSFEKVDILHIMENTITHTDDGYDLSSAAFKSTVSSTTAGTTLKDKLDEIGAATGNNFIVTLNQNETSFAPYTFASAQFRGKTITLVGNGSGKDTVTLKGPGCIFRVEAGVTLALNNITLRGVSNNDSYFITAISGGTIIMNEGSKITGNTVTTYKDWYNYVAGIYIQSNSYFIMNGGEVTGHTMNVRNGYPGGISNNGGNVTINSGTISGNTGDSGGGIYNSSSGKLTINGGTISGNTARSYTVSGSSNTYSGEGGGVCNYYGTFVMTGGTITSNSASRYGSGVYNFYGTMRMSGGTITNNSNVSAFGKDVLLYASASLYLSGSARIGTISIDRGGGGMSANLITIAGNFTGADTVATVNLWIGDTTFSSWPSLIGQEVLKLDPDFIGGSLSDVYQRFTMGQAERYFLTIGSETISRSRQTQNITVPLGPDGKLTN
jgi:hypothetical protein